MYEIRDLKGNVIVKTDDWSRLMSLYRRLRKEIKEAITLHKVEEDDK